MTKKIRYAVVAGGQISQQAFMPGISRTDNSELAALVTGDPAKASKLAGLYGIKAWRYDEYDALLASGEIDAVYVATPNFLHTDYVVRALDAGIHALCEKPMAASLEDGRRIIEAEARSNAYLMIAYRLHNEPATVEMFTRARRGDFGKLMSFTSTFTQQVAEANSRGHNGYWAGPVPDMGTYPLNALRNLFGEEPVSVYAIGTRDPDRGFNFDDTVAVTLGFSGNRVAQFTCSYATEKSESFTLVGTKASIHATPCFMFGPEVGISYTETRADGVTEHAFDPVDQFGNETQYFSNCILTKQRPEADGREGYLDLRVLDAVERSLASGQVIRLEPAKPAQAVSSDQAYRLAPADEPAPDELISVIPQQPMS
ncbi:Gfo/Idh/MocA family protein [Thioclava kandeliae]|uniref:Gfo/Idh/MocA family oxidoreductase n=1 Tax=Thioclava kandeliae TaxID=3070818 RepID=A0ABV1SEC7_9RHOB